MNHCNSFSKFLFVLCFSLSSLLACKDIFARGGGGCFEQGTKIETSQGPVAIEAIKPGDLVRAYKSDGTLTNTRVKAILAHQVHAYYIVTTPTVILHVTGEHPFYLGKGFFKIVKHLRVGDLIQAFDGNKLVQQPIIKIQPIKAATRVYNLQTEIPHTYFAGSIAVHNKGGGGGGGGFGGRTGSFGRHDFSWSAFIISVMIAVVFNRIQAWEKKSLNLDYNYSRKAIENKSLKTMALINFLAKQDKSLDSSTLIQYTRDVFFKLQKCWEARNYLPMKAFLMPDLYIQHTRQIEGMRHNQEINLISNLSVKQIDLVNIRYPEKKTQREFTALITASARDYYYDEKTKKFLRGDKAIETFQEFWTFQLQEQGWLLRDIEQTKESDYLKEENYVEMFTDGQIEKIYQGTVDRLGPVGPGLVKEIEIKANRVDRMLNFLAQSDKLWDRQAMLNFARKVFTHVHLSLEIGKITPEIRAELFPEVLEHFNTTLAKWKAGGNTMEYRNFCVRKVEILLIKNLNDNSKDEYTTRIIAHAQRIQYCNKKIINQDKDVKVFEEFWTFRRCDKEWKLKEVLLKSEGSRMLDVENIDEGSSLDLLKWYYTKKRAI